MEDFITYQIAVKLKEKGFCEKCRWHYYDDTKDKYMSSVPQCYNHGGNTSDAPTITKVLKWLREKGIHAQIEISTLGWYGTLYTFSKDEKGLYDINDSYICLGEIYDDYEKAAISAIKYVLDNNLI